MFCHFYFCFKIPPPSIIASESILQAAEIVVLSAALFKGGLFSVQPPPNE
jgi:hypothetical protein